jgi:DNA-binding transcriptional LysR family regulator
VKEETVTFLDGRSRVALLERGKSGASARDADGRRNNFPMTLSRSESVLAQLAEPHRYPQLSLLRETLLGWRFYHQFRTDADAPLRQPQVGVFTPVLSHDGRDLAAALQTIHEIGDADGLFRAVRQGLDGAELVIASEKARFEVGLRVPGVHRPLEARELSDGTLRYLCLLAALLSPRPPSLLALNEPETSLHPDLLLLWPSASSPRHGARRSCGSPRTHRCWPNISKSSRVSPPSCSRRSRAKRGSSASGWSEAAAPADRGAADGPSGKPAAAFGNAQSHLPNRNMDLESLRLFVDLADTKSFSKTAERHFISQSAVSRRIRALEREFRQTLVERGKGRPGARFTDAGTRLLAGARDLIVQADALQRQMEERSDEVSGTLRVATVYSIGLHTLPPSLSAYLARYPQVNLHLEYQRTDRIYGSLLAGSVDAGIVACPRTTPQIEVIPLHEEAMVVIAPPGHPLEALTEVPVSALENAPFVAFEADIPTRTLTDMFLHAHGTAVQIVQAFDNMETIKRVVEIGLGIAILPEPTVRREVRDGTLIARPLGETSFTRPTGILLRRGRFRSIALQRFLDALRETR